MTLSFLAYIPKLWSLSCIYLLSFLLSLMTTVTLAAQGKKSFPIHLIQPSYRSQVEGLVERSDFQFQTSTAPKKVRLSTMEILFDHPRMSSAMWRHCQFAPSFFAFEDTFNTFFIDDAKGLTGRLILLYSVPGHRIYWVQGKAEAGRLKPFAPAVSAQMITSYRYWETDKGFETQLDTWTKLDNELLGLLVQPFRKYVKGRQDEFIAYINGNIALFGETIDINLVEFGNSLSVSSDKTASKDYEYLFTKAR